MQTPTARETVVRRLSIAWRGRLVTIAYTRSVIGELFCAHLRNAYWAFRDVGNASFSIVPAPRFSIAKLTICALPEAHWRCKARALSAKKGGAFSVARLRLHPSPKIDSRFIQSKQSCFLSQSIGAHLLSKVQARGAAGVAPNFAEAPL